jgi:hypothetical protein
VLSSVFIPFLRLALLFASVFETELCPAFATYPSPDLLELMSVTAIVVDFFVAFFVAARDASEESQSEVHCPASWEQPRRSVPELSLSDENAA